MSTRFCIVLTLVFLGIGFTDHSAHAAAEKIRAMFRDDPASSFVIGWNQVFRNGARAALRYDRLWH